jgi:ABC-type branched-subunit amino acid transport system ATPase component
MSLLVETRDLHKRFGGIHAVRGVNLRVQRGDSGYRNHGAQVGLRAAW